jgi:hypothetical protein
VRCGELESALHRASELSVGEGESKPWQDHVFMAVSRCKGRLLEKLKVQ